MTLHIGVLVPLTDAHRQTTQSFQHSPQFAHHLHTRSLTTRLWKTYSPPNNWPSVSKSNLLGSTNRRATGPVSAVAIHFLTSRWVDTSDLIGAMYSHGLIAIRRPLDAARSVNR
jgi:hypothetical protein